MNDDLYRIVYCSRNLIDDTASQDTELVRILGAAQTNNSARNVTGALLFNLEYFAQVLEGPRTSVEEIFEKIQRDRRHGQITVVENGSAETRAFPDWAMAHVQPATETQDEGLAKTLSLALIKPHESGTAVLDLLKSLVVQD